MQIHNPIIPGFNPDPSIICVGQDFYLATSSFSYFPGIPIYHSRDLMHWEQLSYAFSNPAWLALGPESISAGLFAPTLRYHDGVFYVIVANMSTFKTLVVTATDPAGPWSEPHELHMTFDPDLFWDADGRCYVASSMMGGFGQPIAPGAPRIGVYELDTETWTLSDQQTGLWTGALYDAISPEAPHLYYRDGWYYLMIAEGGTEHFHAVTIARSRSVLGPYEGCAGNPILTHRHLPQGYPICAVGHADLVQTPAGEWYMVFLASRTYGGYHKNMGRETFIAPVIWENGWPVVSPETGRCEFTYPAPAGLTPHPFLPPLARDDFEGDTLGLQWNFLGSPVNPVYRLGESALHLRAIAAPIRPAQREPAPRGMGMPEPVKPRALSFVGRRQQHMSFSAATRIHFAPADSETAGIVLLQNNHANLRIELAQEDGQTVLRALRYVVDTHAALGHHGQDITAEETCLASIPWHSDRAVLRIWAVGQAHQLLAGETENDLRPFCPPVDGGFLGSETCGGFVGAFVGMFCSGNGTDSANEAAFDWFEYSGQ